MRNAIFAAIATVAMSPVAAAECGIHFRVPSGWVAHTDSSKPHTCVIGVSPRNWADLMEKSRWPEEDEAIRIVVINGDFDEAVEAADFVRGEHGELMAMEKGGEVRATKTKHGGMSGWEARSWYRGYANDGAVLGDQSRIYSGFHDAVLLKRGPRSFIVIAYDEYSPDIHVDRVKAAKVILDSLRPN